MSLHQRLLTVTLDLRGACPQDIISTTDLTDRTDYADSCPIGGDIDQKVCCFPWAYALAVR